MMRDTWVVTDSVVGAQTMRWTSGAKEAARRVDALDLTHCVLLGKAVALDEA
jgi:hypothetical protein